MTPEQERLARSLSALASCNPFLPERIAIERGILGEAFVPSAVERGALGRENANVATLAARAEALVSQLCSRVGGLERPSPSESQLYEELVFQVLYHRYARDFDRAMGGCNVSFFDAFAADAHAYLRGLPLEAARGEHAIAHWFAFLFQQRRAFCHIFDSIIGTSAPAAKLRGSVWQSIFTHDPRRYRRVLYAKMADVATLVTGPSGTGKELVARAIGLARYVPFDARLRRFEHEPRDAYFPLNLSALAPSLIESELFGHRRGSFTGAVTDRKGWLSMCPDRGTIFLDEIAELVPELQVKLLRVVQNREFQPLGDTRSQRFSGKIVAATNRRLDAEMKVGRFREDLYYRLCSDLITTPSLREQLDDAPDDLRDLVLFIAKRIVGDDDEAEAVAEEVGAWMRRHLDPRYAWPGNVRELEQCVRNVVIRKDYRPKPPSNGSEDAMIDLAATALTADELIERYCAAVYDVSGSYLEAARRLGLDRRTVKARVEAFRRHR